MEEIADATKVSFGAQTATFVLQYSTTGVKLDLEIKCILPLKTKNDLRCGKQMLIYSINNKAYFKSFFSSENPHQPEGLLHFIFLYFLLRK